MPEELVDVVFLDVDGVLLPFGGSRDGYSRRDLTFSDGCLFPDSAMDALTELLRRMRGISLDLDHGVDGDGDDDARKKIRGNPVLVLSSTWRARPEFVEDILSSFRAYVAAREQKTAEEEEEGPESESEEYAASRAWDDGRLDSFFDLTDPNYHSTRHDEIYGWVRKNVVSRRAGSSSSPEGGKFVVRSWIALDDEDLVNVEGRVVRDATGHAVRTGSSAGLTGRDVDLGVRLARRQMLEFHGITS